MTQVDGGQINMFYIKVCTRSYKGKDNKDKKYYYLNLYKRYKYNDIWQDYLVTSLGPAIKYGYDPKKEVIKTFSTSLKTKINSELKIAISKGKYIKVSLLELIFRPIFDEMAIKPLLDKMKRKGDYSFSDTIFFLILIVIFSQNTHTLKEIVEWGETKKFSFLKVLNRNRIRRALIRFYDNHTQFEKIISDLKGLKKYSCGIPQNILHETCPEILKSKRYCYKEEKAGFKKIAVLVEYFMNGFWNKYSETITKISLDTCLRITNININVTNINFHGNQLILPVLLRNGDYQILNLLKYHFNHK
jgi:hypothetical protein